ncbi:phage tail assembly chaperone [Solibaculum mannosilyticum]|uniref:Phage portal protein n=1 Tax=Solibaculum mannosilyticum TaxID=2780922 RepID=A0A7I8D1F5_9FIRM|nr:phage portal protein [Solibaculum mannosilyticum]BCI60641.1 phage portal protein [Solibaculum mannosilyticum]CZT56709.1 Phage XkdN-like protein [Eubacteriaceae bacterium CHKCI005]
MEAKVIAGNLSAFLAQNALPVENVKYVASKRFVDPQTGDPMQWELRALTSQEDEILRRACTKNVPLPGKKGQYTPQMDTNLYVAKMAAACTVYPDLNDASLQDSYHVMGAEALLKTMLLAGEYADYIQQVQAICGFDASFEDKVDEAKN